MQHDTTTAHGGAGQRQPLRVAAKIAPNQPAAAAAVPPPARWNTAGFLTAAPETATAADLSLDQNIAESFRHGGWASTRRRVLAAMKATPGVSDRRVSAFCCCGSDAFIEERISAVNGKPAEYRLKSTKCHDRFCVPCARDRATRIRSNLLPYLFTRNNLSLITLTLLQTTAPLSATLDRITKAFRTLRASKLWQKAVVGGVGIIEVKLNHTKTAWNVHYHVIAETSFMRQQDLGTEWHKATGDSYIVDVRRVGAKTGAVTYVTKYISKASDHQIVSSPKHLAEALTAFDGRRLISTFGKWRGLKLSENPDETIVSEHFPGTWRSVGTLGSVLRDAAAGDAHAREIASFVFARDKRRPGSMRGLPGPHDSS